MSYRSRSRSRWDDYPRADRDRDDSWDRERYRGRDRDRDDSRDREWYRGRERDRDLSREPYRERDRDRDGDPSREPYRERDRDRGRERELDSHSPYTRRSRSPDRDSRRPLIRTSTGSFTRPKLDRVVSMATPQTPSAPAIQRTKSTADLSAPSLPKINSSMDQASPISAASSTATSRDPRKLAKLNTAHRTGGVLKSATIVASPLASNVSTPQAMQMSAASAGGLNQTDGVAESEGEAEAAMGSVVMGGSGSGDPTTATINMLAGLSHNHSSLTLAKIEEATAQNDVERSSKELDRWVRFRDKNAKAFPTYSESAQHEKRAADEKHARAKAKVAELEVSLNTYHIKIATILHHPKVPNSAEAKRVQQLEEELKQEKAGRKKLEERMLVMEERSQRLGDVSDSHESQIRAIKDEHFRPDITRIDEEISLVKIQQAAQAGKSLNRDIDIKKLRTDQDKLTSDLGHTRERLEGLPALRLDVSKMKQKDHNLDAMINSHTREIIDVRKTQAELKEENNTVQAKHETVVAKAEEARVGLEKTMASFSKSLENADTNFLRIDAGLHDLKVEYDSFAGKNEASLIRASTLQEIRPDLARLDSSFSALRADLNKISTPVSQTAEREGSINAWTKPSDAIAQERLKTGVEQLRTALEQVKLDIDHLKNQGQNGVSEMRVDNELLQEINTEFATKLEKRDEVLAGELETLQETMDQLRNDFTKGNETQRKALTHRDGVHQHAMDLVKRDYDGKIEEVQTRLAEIEAESSNWRRNISNLTKWAPNRASPPSAPPTPQMAQTVNLPTTGNDAERAAISNAIAAHRKDITELMGRQGAFEDVKRRVNGLEAEVKYMRPHLQAVQKVIHNLEARYNSLTTEPIIRAMCVQLGEMYPYALTMQKEVEEIKRHLQALQAVQVESRGLETRVAKIEGLETPEQLSRDLQVQVKKVDDFGVQLQNVLSRTESVIDLQNQMQELQTRIAAGDESVGNKLENLAGQLDTMSTQWAGKEEKFNEKLGLMHAAQIKFHEKSTQQKTRIRALENYATKVPPKIERPDSRSSSSVPLAALAKENAKPGSSRMSASSSTNAADAADERVVPSSDAEDSAGEIPAAAPKPSTPKGISRTLLTKRKQPNGTNSPASKRRRFADIRDDDSEDEDFRPT